MKNFNKTFKINPLYESDGYKVGHKRMLAEGTTRLYGTWIPRSVKYMHPSITKVMSAGQQMVVRHLHSSFQENFFDIPREQALSFCMDISSYLGMPYDGLHFEQLYDLGYLPIRIKSLPEGIFTDVNIPHMTFVNTVDGFGWLTLYLETFISKLAWRISTAATLGYQFKKNAVEWVNATDKENIFLSNFMCHDFSSRGGNPFDSIAVGLGHAFSNLGSDTLNVIPASRYYYDAIDDDPTVYSVNASEHSVSTTKIFTVGERQMIIDWCKEFPTGILSLVSDTFDLWKLITEYLTDPEVKEAILARDGKLVIRPDSGDPVDIVCGGGEKYTDTSGEYKTPAEIGVIELLWDIFGGKVNSQGYKVLDSHIGCIYGDSINLDRQVEIYKRLEAKGFAATNIVCGVGSFTYIFTTRDSMGWAAKGSWFEFKNGNEIHEYNIYKDPVTDVGTKKSLKGLIQVCQNKLNGDYIAEQECTWEEENQGELQTIYEDGVLKNHITIYEIRDKLSFK